MTYVSRDMPDNARFQQIKELMGEDKHLICLVAGYCNELQVPSLKDQKENIKYHDA